MKRTVLTIATGKPLYVNLAVNLARSFFLWHTDGQIIFQLATDQPEAIPEDIRSRIEVIAVKPGELGEGFSSKLHLDALASLGQTLFIDSDCLIYGNLTSVFDAFKGHKVSVVGGYIADGEWFGDIRKICAQYNVPHIPKFNGGIYYLEKGAEADKVYKTARQLEKKYDEIGFVRLRARPNDEVIMGLAMQLEGMTPLTDDGTIMSDPLACPGKYYIDVIKGETRLENPPAPDPLHRDWYPFHKVSPLIVHFLGHYTMNYQYRLEVYRLKMGAQKRLNWSTAIYGCLTIEYSERFKIFMKNTFRPPFHTVFGIRKIKQSPRV